MTTVLSRPRSSRVTTVSLEVSATRSMFQTWARNSAPPMMSSARSPRSRATVSTEGRAAAVSALPGGRSRWPTARWAPRMAQGSAISTASSHIPRTAEATQSSQSSRKRIESSQAIGAPLQQRGGRRLGMGRRMAPDHLQPDSQQAEAEDIGYQPPGLEIEAELAQQHDRGIAEGVPAGQDENPPVPEAGGGPVHGQDAESVDILETRRARRQEEAAHHQDEAEVQEGDEILQQDLAQQRRPVEDQEGADAAEAEGRHQQHAIDEAGNEGDQPLAHRLHGKIQAPAPEPPGRPEEEPGDPQAQADEDGQQDDEQAAAMGLGHQRIPGALEFGRHLRNDRRPVRRNDRGWR